MQLVLERPWFMVGTYGSTIMKFFWRHRDSVIIDKKVIKTRSHAATL